MPLSKEEVLKVGRLGRIHLSDEEVERFASQLSSIFDYVDKLGELDTKSVEPLAHALALRSVLRKDEPRESLSPEEAVRGAPDATGDFFRVPRVIDDGTGAVGVRAARAGGYVPRRQAPGAPRPAHPGRGPFRAGPRSGRPGPLTACEMRDAIRRGDLSAAEATEACLEAIERLDPKVRAFLSVDAEGARRRAAELDDRRARGEPTGLLDGLPVAVKDNLCTSDSQPTTCASRILEGWRAPYNAHVVERLLAEGAVIVGKTNLDEFAMGSSTENSGLHPTHNPWDIGRVPGGSSGGSAAAVAARMVPLALGSDTGGSIRQPAALCGVVGMKPTYGRVSRYGLVAFASSLDQIGPLARTVGDTALLLQATSGRDERDSTSVPGPVPDYLATLDEPVEGLRIGVPRQFFGEGLNAEVERLVREALAVYEAEGAELVEIDLPLSTDYSIATYYIIAPSEASSNLARYDGVHYGFRAADHADMIDMYMRTRAEGFGDEVKRRIMIGTHALSAGYYDAYYKKALKVRRLIRQDFEQAFEKVDCLMGPTSPTPAFRLDEKTDDPLTMYLCDVYTVGCSLAAIAGLSVPCGFTDEGLPVGLQILGDVFSEEKLLRIARMYERKTHWAERRPPLCEEGS